MMIISSKDCASVRRKALSEVSPNFPGFIAPLQLVACDIDKKNHIMTLLHIIDYAT